MKYLPFILLIAGAVAAVYFLYYKPKQEQAAAETQKAIDDQRAELFATPPPFRVADIDPSLLKTAVRSSATALSATV